MTIWLNGALLPDTEALLPAHSAGMLLGWGVFTTLGIWEGHSFALSRHLARLRRNAIEAGITLTYSDSQLARALAETIAANDLRHGLARLTVTAQGDGRWKEEAGSDISILVLEHSTTPAPFRPLALEVSPFRVPSGGALEGIKSTSYGPHLRAWQTAQRRGFDEALLLTGGGLISEASRANVFWVREGEIYTPALQCGVLPGIARELILEWCQRCGVQAYEVTQSLDALASANEFFVTASTTGPRPVASLAIGSKTNHWDAPGPLTRQLTEMWCLAVNEGQI